MDFENREDLENFISEKLGMNATVVSMNYIDDGQKVDEQLRIQYGPTIENIVHKKLEAMENGDFNKARSAQEIYSKYCGVSKDSGAYSVQQEIKLVELTKGALEKLSNELKDISNKTVEEKRKLLNDCEDFIATVDGVSQTESIDLTEFKDSTNRLREELPPEEKEEEVMNEIESEEPELSEVEDLGMENIPAHERNEAEDIKQEMTKDEQEKELPEDKWKEPGSRMVKIDAYESMYDKAKHKIRELFNKIRNAIMPRSQENEKDISTDDDGR